MNHWWELLSDTPTAQAPLTVYEREPRNTGILTAEGHPIYRQPEPIGFLTGRIRNGNPSRRNEWHCRIGKVKWK